MVKPLVSKLSLIKGNVVKFVQKQKLLPLPKNYHNTKIFLLVECVSLSCTFNLFHTINCYINTKSI